MSDPEVKINQMLVATLRAHKLLEKRGKPELASAVLCLGSTLADLMLSSSGVEATPVVCSRCGRRLSDGREVEFYNKVGECSVCDHVRNCYYK